MNNIISYSLYEQKDKEFDRSGHDSFSKEKNRYWTNIPFIFITNNLYFNDFKTKFYIHDDITNNKLYTVLDKLSKLQNFEIEIMNKEQKGTSPSIWRFKSIWDSNIYFSRDADSVISPKEYMCMKYFINSDYWMNNIRGIWQHNFEGTVLMAGLCGFKSSILKKELPLPESFDDYLAFCESNCSSEWGCDQINLIDFFIKTRSKRVISKLLDFYIQPHFDRIDRVFRNLVEKSRYYNINSLNENDFKNIDMSGFNKEFLNLTNNVTGWLGQPIDVRGASLNKLLSLDIDICKEVKNLLISDDILKEYYKC